MARGAGDEPVRDELDEAWRKAFATPGEHVPIGRAVICDVCDKDWTDDKTPGGFLFGSYAYCPDCAAAGLISIKGFNEERLIQAFCPADEAYADFVRRMRGPGAGIKVTVFK